MSPDPSSCALIFFGGVDRTSYGKIGIHRPYFQIAPDASPPSSATINEMYSGVEAYLKEMKVPPQVFEMMMLKNPEDMQVFEGDSIFSIVPEVDPATNEKETAFLAQRYGLDTVSYRQIHLQAEVTCAATYSDFETTEETVLKAIVASSCVEAHLWGVQTEELEGLKAQVRESCRFSDQNQKDFLSYKADVLSRVLGGNGQGEMELDWYGFLPALEMQECAQRIFGR